MSNIPQIGGGNPASTPSNTLPDLTPEETRLLSMNRDAREDHFNSMGARGYEMAARIKEYELQKQVAEDLEHSMSKNVQYQRMLRGAHPRVASSDTDNENTRQALAQPFAIGAPQALIDTIPIMVGGIQLGPQQAKDMLATGQISKRAYDAGLARELAAYGYAAPGFRTA